MRRVKITFKAEGKDLEDAVESLRFDIHETMRRTGDGGDADLLDYVEKVEQLTHTPSPAD